MQSITWILSKGTLHGQQNEQMDGQWIPASTGFAVGKRSGGVGKIKSGLVKLNSKTTWPAALTSENLQLRTTIASFAAVFWMSRNAPPKEIFGGALRDIQKKKKNCEGE